MVYNNLSLTRLEGGLQEDCASVMESTNLPRQYALHYAFSPLRGFRIKRLYLLLLSLLLMKNTHVKLGFEHNVL